MPLNSEPDQQVLQNAPAVLVSLIVHLIVLILLAFFLVKEEDNAVLVLDVRSSENEELAEFESFALDPAEPESAPSSEEVTVSVFPTAEPAMLGDLAPLDLSGTVTGLSEGLSSKIRDAQENGIEIVVVFDSTGSMGSEIAAVKRRIGEIGNTILEKIPRARFSLITYRDRRDIYLVKGIGLSNNLKRIESFISAVQAQGGGDHPEALEAGMQWALDNNALRSDSQKVMLIFGDAPPHRQHLAACIKMAREFQGYGKGRVSTITCQSHKPMREFYEIAKAGGGDAYTMQNSHHLMEELLVLAFGQEHREGVLEYFDLK